MTIASLLPDSAKVRIRSALGRLGIEIGAYTGSFAEHRAHLLSTAGVGTVWDVGAHVGQYANRIRGHGFAGTIVSIEPGRDAHSSLSAQAQRDPRWLVKRVAVADSVGSGTLNVSANGQSSSLLAMDDRHVSASPASRYIAREEVAITTLDVLEAELAPPPAYFLKLDLQGAEGLALRGAESVLNRCVACEIELSLFSLYEGGGAWQDIVAFLEARGFAICDMERVFFDQASRDLLQINALFRRVQPVAAAGGQNPGAERSADL